MSRRRKASPRICYPPPSACEPGGDGELVTYNDVVDEYIRRYRADAEQEGEFFRRKRSLKEAIRYAALSIRPDGKRQDHQRRIPADVLAEGERNLQASKAELAPCKSFEDVHKIVVRELLGIYGIGDLTVYDVTTRISAHLGQEPERVYLHAGTREGARALGLDHRRKSLDVVELPAAFRRLRARDIENCLCIYKAALEAMRTREGAVAADD